MGASPNGNPGTEAQLNINHQLILTPGIYTLSVCNHFTVLDEVNEVCASGDLTVTP